MSGTPGELTNTLILALSQCQDQVRTIRDQAARIERLQRANARLREDLQNAKQEQRNDAVEDEPSSQVDDLFQKHVEAQAEIQKLRKKLKQYKDKANNLAVPFSSPSTRSSTPSGSSPKRPPRQARTVELLSVSASSSPPRKRPKLDNEVLREVPLNNVNDSSSPLRNRSKNVLEEEKAAEPIIADDGQEHQHGHEQENLGKHTAPMQRFTYGRLEDLLAAPTPSRTPLNRPTSPDTNTIFSKPSKTTTKSFNISNISHVTSDTPSPKTVRQEHPPDKECSAIDPVAHVRQPTTTYSRSLNQRNPLPRSSKRAREDGEPFRARPPSKLSLKHFKPNPRWLDSHGVSYDEFLHGQNATRINALAATLPRLPGQHEQGGPVTDDELLLEFLGPGSEDRIACLTRLARVNLITEAKTKRVAKYFARQRADYDREQDPPGFWSIDMPNTQEGEENRRKAVEIEQEEVKKRYEEAIIGHGRWVFADE